MTDHRTLKYEEIGRVAVITLNRPEVLNAFDSVMMREIHACWRELRDNDAVPLHLNDPGHFLPPKTAGHLYKPVIAAVNGMACGGAFYLLGEVEFIIAAEHATFFDPHTTFGMAAVFEPMMMLQRMPLGEVMRMSLMGSYERMTAARAHQIGLVQEVVPGAELRDAALRVAEIIASQPARAVETTVRSVWTAQEVAYRQALEMGQTLIEVGTDDASLIEGHEAFASGKRIEWRPR